MSIYIDALMSRMMNYHVKKKARMIMFQFYERIFTYNLFFVDHKYSRHLKNYCQ